jgi:hypothetical protein
MRHRERDRLVPRSPILTLYSCGLLEIKVAVSSRDVNSEANRFKNPAPLRYSLACLLNGHVRSGRRSPRSGAG